MEQAVLCRVCGSSENNLIIELQQVPVTCNRLWSDRRQAMSAPVADILLYQCTDCGHLFNARFDPARVDYGAHYENSLEVSPRFERYARDLAATLVEKFGLQRKTIVETGCGSGFFLKLLCDGGDNRGYGFDPERPHDRFITSARIAYYAETFNQQHAGLDPDLLVCRHVLEHVDTPVEFVEEVTSLLRIDGSTRLFFEVPNSGLLHDGRDVWDLIYEHCSYFTRDSLARLFQLAGYRVDALYSTFDEQFLCIETSRTQPGDEPAPPFSAGSHGADYDAVRLREAMTTAVVSWQGRLADMYAADKKVVLWGAGSKGLTFLNLLQTDAHIDAVVDINPLKQGRFIPVTGHRVIAPEALSDRDVDYVILMNPVYADEVAAMLRQSGVAAELLSV